MSAIVGQDRLTLSFTGQASHAGTTPMALRRDALAAAARVIVAAEELACATPGLVATVGTAEVSPGAGNVVPGHVAITLDLRSADDAVRLTAREGLLQVAEEEAERRRVSLSVRLQLSEPATPMALPFRRGLLEAAADCGLTAPELVSGAGHDAQVLAGLMPAGMLFVRSPNALSHHPDELVHLGDVAWPTPCGSACAFLGGWRPCVGTCERRPGSG